MNTAANIKQGFSHPPQATSSDFPKGSMLITEQDYEKYLTISKGLSKKSIKTYLTRFRLVKKWLEDIDLELTKRNVEEFLYQKKEKGYTNAAINSYIQALNHIAGCYKSHGYDGSFTEDIKTLPKKRFSGIPLSVEEVNRLLKTGLTYKNRNGVDCSNLDDKYLTLTEFMAFTACRYDEAASLKVSQLDIDGGRAMLVDTKNKENRFIFFDGPVKEHLRKLIEKKDSEELVFTNSKNGKMHSGDFGNNLKQRARKAGITKKINPHLLRHTYATTYYNYTHDIAMVAKILGHRDVQTTYETYVHFDTEGIQQATNRHPLMSQYIPPREVLRNVKSAIDNLRIDDDKRLRYDVFISDEELTIRIKTIEA